MNKRIDLTNLGGFPMTQFTLSEMQDSYRNALSALSKFIGDKTILYGVEIVGVNVTSGWISVNGELMPFVGGPLNTQVYITDLPGVDRTFEDTTVYPVYFTKTATCALLGSFDFADLKTLDTYKVLQTTLETLLTDFAAHTHAYSAITGKPVIEKGSISIGNVAVESTHTITLVTTQANTGYFVGITIISNGTAFNDNNITWAVKDKTVNEFKIVVEDQSGVTNNIAIEYFIINF